MIFMISNSTAERCLSCQKTWQNKSTENNPFHCQRKKGVDRAKDFRLFRSHTTYHYLFIGSKGSKRFGILFIARLWRKFWESLIDAWYFATSCQSNKYFIIVASLLSPRTHHTSKQLEIIIHPSSAILPLYHYVCCLLCEAFDRHQKQRSINEVFVPFCNKTILLLDYEHNKHALV